MMQIFNSLVELLTERESVVLTTILSRSGSAPRAVGTRMIVRSDGSIIGTIGGGILEARVQQLAEHAFDHRGATVRDFVLTAEDAEQMGMICGGQLRVLIQYVNGSDSAYLGFHRQVKAALDLGKQAWLITEIPAGERARNGLVQCLCRNDGTRVFAGEHEDFPIPPPPADSREPQVVAQGAARFLMEPLCHEGVVFIFGAGHISRQLALLTRLVGFRTVVLDDRAAFANRERFASADDVVVLPSFDGAMAGLSIDKNSFIVLVTRGHAHDKTLLGEALKTRAGYIGMIGSRRKRDAVYQDLEKEGFPAEAFERVHSPIGLSIAAETPEEIAVSITAELIAVRAGANPFCYKC
ncbi:MAG: XdhC family protein [Desulfobacteraceae bacterium]|jgi:xanthine dehydrogenase accessory factor